MGDKPAEAMRLPDDLVIPGVRPGAQCAGDKGCAPFELRSFFWHEPRTTWIDDATGTLACNVCHCGTEFELTDDGYLIYAMDTKRGQERDGRPLPFARPGNEFHSVLQGNEFHAIPRGEAATR